MNRGIGFKKKARIVVIDDNYDHLSGIKELIELESDFEVVAIASSANVGISLIKKYRPETDMADLDNFDAAKALAESIGITVEKSWGLGRIVTEIFDEVAEAHLIQPTFITEYPAEVSPLARRNDVNPEITDRFEFFIGGREIGNGFSELNDAEDQAERFQEQVNSKAAGDDEAMFYDEDYVTALEYGLPPTAGLGIGIDRMIMLFTNSHTIRDVILFPAMRPQK